MSTDIRLRGGSGLGDSIYLRVVAEHLVRKGDRVCVLSDWPDVFIGSGATVERFSRNGVTMLAHYATARQDQRTTQFQDMLNSARIAEAVPLRFKWTVRNPALIERLKAEADGRPIVLVHGGREAFGRNDGLGAEMLPEREAFETVLGAVDAFKVRVGKGEQKYPLSVDLDLSDQTSVSDVLDIAAACDGVVGQCSFIIPLAECFGKPLLTVWASRGLKSQHPIIKLVTPQKILAAPSTYVIDDVPLDEMAAVAWSWRPRSVAQPAVA